MARIANPIYDAPFKYLMDSPRVAKTLIAAVLKLDRRDILEIRSDRNEITTYEHDEVRACRLDFCVKIRTAEGEKTVYIELQKVWNKVDMARFRKYLAAQYVRASNVDVNDTPLPVYAIYILGEKVDTLTEAVTYINRKYFNQKGEEINKEKKSWFVECLSHDMAVIQVPLLKPRPDSTLDNILTIFDQKNLDPNDKRIMWYDIDDYDVPKGELRDEMRVMVRRLETAVVDEKVQMQMDLEDHAEAMFAAKLNAEEKLAQQEKILAENEKIMAENEKILQQQENQLQESEKRLQENEKRLQEKDSQIQEKESQIQEKESQIQEKESQIETMSAQMISAIRLMRSGGIGIDVIAKTFNKDIKFVESLLSQ
ncbi:MAG: hypothetical protein IKP73_17360 [Bacteroidales bacterium]|nr:hypothetical protein [Bacteroidales bacterium]